MWCIICRFVIKLNTKDKNWQDGEKIFWKLERKKRFLWKISYIKFLYYTCLTNVMLSAYSRKIKNHTYFKKFCSVHMFWRFLTLCMKGLTKDLTHIGASLTVNKSLTLNGDVFFILILWQYFLKLLLKFSPKTAVNFKGI